MKLHEMDTKSLLELHNSIAEMQAGPKSFATKARLIARIKLIATNRSIDLTTFEQLKTASDAVPQADDTSAADASPETKKPLTGKGIGRLARSLLLDPAGYPHAVIAAMINARIESAQATAKSIRWYACRMRKEGTEVPDRHRSKAKGIDTAVEPEEIAEDKSRSDALAVIR